MAFAFSKPRESIFSQPVYSHRPFTRHKQFNWDYPIYELQLAIVDLRGASVHRTIEQQHNAYDGSPNLAVYLPLKVRYSAVVVAREAKLVAPSYW